MSVSELTGEELDAAVAKALGYEHHGAVGVFDRNPDKPWCLSEVNDWWKDPTGAWLCGPCHGFPYGYSSEWERGGPIIERERIEVGFMGTDHGWQAAMNPEAQADWQIRWHDGPTPLIAAMRAFVASRLVSSPT
jgi:hypothetical protein